MVHLRDITICTVQKQLMHLNRLKPVYVREPAQANYFQVTNHSPEVVFTSSSTQEVTFTEQPIIPVNEPAPKETPHPLMIPINKHVLAETLRHPVIPINESVSNPHKKIEPPEIYPMPYHACQTCSVKNH